MGKLITRERFRWLVSEVAIGLRVLGHREDLAFLNNFPQFLPPLLQDAFAIFKEELRLHGPKVLVAIANHSHDLSNSSLGFFWDSNGAHLHIPCHLLSNLNVLHNGPPSQQNQNFSMFEEQNLRTYKVFYVYSAS